MSVRFGIYFLFNKSVIPTEPVDRLCRSTGEWRDLLFWRVAAPLIRRKILPCRIQSLDQPYLLRSIPALELLFPTNRSPYIVERLEVNQTMTSILFTEAVSNIVLMFPYAPVDAVRHSDVQHPRFAGDDVHEITFALHNSKSLDCVT
jgi:hypothetical protein